MSEHAIENVVDEERAAEILGISRITLRKMRSVGQGKSSMPPVPFLRYSARCIRYQVSELERWKESRRVAIGSGCGV